MATRNWKLAVLGGWTVIMWLAAACGSATAPRSSPSAVAGSAAKPRLVFPRSVGGSPGKGPLVISSPTRLPGGKIGSQKVVLGDRTLVIWGVTTRPASNRNSILIGLALTVRNTGEKTIYNKPPFFQL